MRRRYCEYMQTIQPSDILLHNLEREMKRELRKKSPAKTLAAVCAAAAVFAIALVGVRLLQPTRVDVVTPPVLSPGAGTATTTAPDVLCIEDPPVPLELEMLDESVPMVLTDVNYYYGCYPLMPQESLSVTADSSPDSAIVETLYPGTVYWYADTPEEISDDALRRIRWYDPSAGMKTGWAGEHNFYDGEDDVLPLAIPGKARFADTVMRYGADGNAPEVTRLSEGQYLHLCYRVGDWIFATTAPFDQAVENPTPPTSGWIHVGDLWGLTYEKDQPDETPQPTVNPAITLPPDDMRLDLEMSDEAVFAVSSIVNQDWNHSVLMFEDYLAGSSTHGSHLVEICQSSELNSVVIAPLRPGMAYWPVKGSDNAKELTDEKGKVIGYAELVTYLDENTNTLREGWRHVIYDAAPLPEVPDNPVESVQIPGKVKVGGTPLRYGRSADAPVVAVLEEGRRLGLAYRVDNWIYASTEPFCPNGEKPFTGWIHISEVLGMQWRTTINHVDLTADEVNLRAAPDGELIYTISKYDADNGLLSYGGATVPGKKGDWHFVTINFAWDDFVQTGYVSADHSRLNTFRLESELDLTGVVSATLRYSESAPFGAAEQTIAGEKLSLLLERLKNAYSESVYTPVCGEGSAALTLVYADGSSVELPISGDSCTQVQYEDVTYDLKTDAERTERFLNDGGAGLSDILSPIFDEIKIP